MKKEYNIPTLNIEVLSLDDIILVSGTFNESAFEAAGDRDFNWGEYFN